MAILNTATDTHGACIRKMRLVDLCDRIRQDPTNAGYLILLGLYTADEVRIALDELDAGLADASAKG